jgi:thioredoxin reductase (NADPH)
VIGGGNSAGQAALFLAKHAHHVHLVARRDSLAETMSDYLVQRLISSERITLHMSTVLSSIEESSTSPIVMTEHVTLGRKTRLSIRNIFIMIGADPNTEWLCGGLALDESGFIVTGNTLPGARSNFETSFPGVFAVGDVRSGSLKRVASAAGEGAAVIADVHRYLAADGDNR